MFYSFDLFSYNFISRPTSIGMSLNHDTELQRSPEFVLPANNPFSTANHFHPSLRDCAWNTELEVKEHTFGSSYTRERWDHSQSKRMNSSLYYLQNVSSQNSWTGSPALQPRFLGPLFSPIQKKAIRMELFSSSNNLHALAAQNTMLLVLSLRQTLDFYYSNPTWSFFYIFFVTLLNSWLIFKAFISSQSRYNRSYCCSINYSLTWSCEQGHWVLDPFILTLQLPAWIGLLANQLN